MFCVKKKKLYVIFLGRLPLQISLDIFVPGYLLEFEIILNEHIPCPKQTNMPVMKTVLDVACDVKFLVNVFTLQGAIAPYVCSVYISGGKK